MSSRLSQEHFKDQEESWIQESRIKFQDSRIIKIKIQDSKIQESREDLIKISIKKFFKTLSSTRSFHKIITKEFYSLVIDYQCFKTLRFSKFKMKSHICWCVIDYTFMVIDYQWLFSKNSFPKVTFLQVTCFWRFFQKSYLFKWLVLKELPRVTSFDLSHQETINMWPWHETLQQSNSDPSSHSIILSFNLSF